jgi:hypothetical protein
VTGFVPGDEPVAGETAELFPEPDGLAGAEGITGLRESPAGEDSTAGNSAAESSSNSPASSSVGMRNFVAHLGHFPGLPASSCGAVS